MVGKGPAVRGRTFCLDAMSAGPGQAGEDPREVIDGGVAVADEEDAGADRGAFLARATGTDVEDQKANGTESAHAGDDQYRTGSQRGHAAIMRPRAAEPVVLTALS